MRIDNWICKDVSFGASESEVVDKFGKPNRVNAISHSRIAFFYGDINFNFENGQLSSIGFGDTADLLLDGINPFKSENEFMASIASYKSVDCFGLIIFEEIGLIIEGFGVPLEPRSLSLCSREEMAKYLH